MESVLFHVLCLLILCESSYQHSNNRAERNYASRRKELALHRIHVDPERHWFVDDLGRVRIFRGINLVTKHPPWYPEMMLNQTFMEDLKSWGFNVVRLGTMWSGVEPAEGKYDENYMKKIEEIVSGLASHGVYSLLDMHQDALAKKYGTYDGIPEWLISQFPKPKHPFPWPMTGNDSYWGCSYITFAVSNAFQLLYDNYNGATDKMAAVWKYIADRFKNKNSVLGYELINEPWAGNIYEDFDLALPGCSGRKNLAPLYDKLHKSIREVDDESLIFFEPVTWGSLVPTKANPLIDLPLIYFFNTHSIENFFKYISYVCGPMDINVNGFIAEILEIFSKMARPLDILNDYASSVLGPGFDHVPGGDSYRNRSVFSWHYYCWLINLAESDSKYDPYDRAFCDSMTGPAAFSTALLRAAEAGAGNMLTEFGACRPNATLPDTMGYQECEFILESAEKHFTSWTYWESYTGGLFWDSSGNVISDRVKLFARPFAYAVAGIPHSTLFDPATRIFTLCYKPDITNTAPTEIFVGPMHYPNRSFKIKVSLGLTWSFDESNQDILLVHYSTNELPGAMPEYSLIQITPFDMK